MSGTLPQAAPETGQGLRSGTSSDPAADADLQRLKAAGDSAYRRLVEGVEDYAIFLLSPGGVIASWNLGASRNTGYSAQEAIGQHFSLFYTDEARDAGWPDEELRRATRLGRFEDEGWRVRKDGSRFWANVVITSLSSDTGEALGFSKVTRDLTERMEQQRRLRDSERNLRLLIEGVQDYAIFQLSPEGVITTWNLGAQRIKGYTASEAIGQHFSVFYPEEARERGWPQEELRRAQLAGRFEDEGWRVRRDGSLIWANVVITAIRDQQGELLGFSKVTRDLTERRRHEALLQEREENLRRLVEGAHEYAMVLLDRDGRIRTWNKGAERLLGFKEEDVLGRFAAKLLSGEVISPLSPSAREQPASGDSAVLVEGWISRADGSRFWAEVSTSPLALQDNADAGSVQIIRDLTERRRMAALVDEGRRMTEFIAMLSHEIRNPLAPVANVLGILGRETLSPRAQWCVDVASRQIRHLTRLIEDLLDVSRVTTGKVQLAIQPVELVAMVEQALVSLRPMVEAAGHQLVTELSADALPIQGDTTRLTQLLNNLLSNSAKYTPEGGTVIVRLRAEAGEAVLSVSDNGIGMSAQTLERAFEPFVQGDQAYERAQGGLGIGLALVGRIAALHGGSASAHSAGPGQGSDVTVRLPLATAPVPAA